jgi:putrescine---pyruvate transaminase
MPSLSALIPMGGPMMHSSFWHPFSNMADVEGHEIVMARGEGSWLWDEADNRYLDATASLWYCNIGYGRREMVEAAATQMLRLPSYSTFDVYANRPALELAERLSTIAPTGPQSIAFFTNGGSDAIDTAAKIARRYWQVSGQPHRTVIIAREGAYHGMNAYGTSLAGIEANAEGWGQLIPDVLRVPAHDLNALQDALEGHEGRIAAFFGEPVIGAAGIYPPAYGYWKGVQELCRRHDVLLVADEVVTGFGRLGTWFASERYGITPDMVTGAKGVTSGYLPLGVVLCGERVRSMLWNRAAGQFRHGYTYSGHAAAAAVGLRNLEIIELERLCDRVAALEPVLARELETLVSHPLVAEVRTVGLLGGVQLDADALARQPDLIDRVVRDARDRGVLVRGLMGHTLQISPPFVITEDELAGLAGTLMETLDSLVHERAVA